MLAIDLEWRPDRRTSSSNPVAMVQLASSQHALIVRTCLLGGAAHQILCSFLRCMPINMLKRHTGRHVDQRRPRSSVQHDVLWICHVCMQCHCHMHRQYFMIRDDTLHAHHGHALPL